MRIAGIAQRFVMNRATVRHVVRLMIDLRVITNVRDPRRMCGAWVAVTEAVALLDFGSACSIMRSWMKAEARLSAHLLEHTERVRLRGLKALHPHSQSTLSVCFNRFNAHQRVRLMGFRFPKDPYARKRSPHRGVSNAAGHRSFCPGSSAKARAGNRVPRGTLASDKPEHSPSRRPGQGSARMVGRVVGVGLAPSRKQHSEHTGKGPKELHIKGQGALASSSLEHPARDRKT